MFLVELSYNTVKSKINELTRKQQMKEKAIQDSKNNLEKD